MSIAIAALIVLGFLFSVGCCCGCSCTSCSQSEDEAATYEVTIDGIINGSCCTGCADANGTYNLTFQGSGISVCTFNSPLSQAGYGCCYAYHDIGGATVDCTACPDGSVLSATDVLINMFISSNVDETGAASCTKTLTTVVVSMDLVAGWIASHAYVANFQDLADPMLDCSLASYDARDIPFTGAVAEPPTVGCDWWTTPATCTVTSTT